MPTGQQLPDCTQGQLCQVNYFPSFEVKIGIETLIGMMNMTGKKMYFNLFKIAFLLIFSNVSVFQIALCENFDKNTTLPHTQTHDKTNKPSTTRPVDEAQIRDTRFRRAANSEHRDRCSTSQCTGKDTLFENVSSYYNCYCDNACYETFQDCCPDFVKTCGKQKKTNSTNSQALWKCVAVGNWDNNGYCHLFGPSGIWMIVNCSSNWALDETRTRCENVSEKFSFPVEDYLPVVGKNGFTYRNKHCAECNEQTNYQSWEIEIVGHVTPPKEYNLNDTLRFVLENGGEIRPTKPKNHMPRRYCAGARYVDSCSNTSHSAYQECLNGPVETVGDWNRGYFKNEACALCNGKTTAFGDRSIEDISIEDRSIEDRSIETGFVPKIKNNTVPETISIVFRPVEQTRRGVTIHRKAIKNCSEGLVYDDILKHCREGVITNIGDTLSDVFLIILSFESGAIEIPLSLLNITKHLKLSLIHKFALTPNQLTGFQFYGQYVNMSFVATFHLTLTPYQEFILDNENNTLNISTESQKFLGLLKFTTNFTMQSGGYRFPVTKLVSKQLACFQGRTLQSHEYDYDNISGNVIENTTGKVFSKNEYKILRNMSIFLRIYTIYTQFIHNLSQISAFRMSRWCFCNAL